MDIFESLKSFGKASFQLLRDHLKLFELEAKLAAKSVYPLISLSIFYVLSGFSLWLIILAMIGYGIFLLSSNLFIALLGTALVNLILLLIIKLMMKQLSRNLKFKKSRHHLKSYNQLPLEFSHEQTRTEETN